MTGIPTCHAVIVGVAQEQELRVGGERVVFHALEGVDHDVIGYQHLLAHALPDIPTRLTVLTQPDNTTPEGILGELRAAVTACAPGDLLVVALAGHGYQVVDSDGDESERLPGDLKDEVFVATGGLIVDDDLHDVWAGLAAKDGVRVITFADCCHADDLAIELDVQRLPGTDAKEEFHEPDIRSHTREDQRWDHIGFAAAPSWMKAKEIPGTGASETRGALSLAVELTWRSPATCESWFTAVSRFVEGMAFGQQPRLHVAGADPARILASQPFVVS